MRIWSLHPKYLDRIGLVAVWRESLLAKKVLQGKTRGYRSHPQLERFRGRYSAGLINKYLLGVWEEASRRGYRFDRKKVGKASSGKASVTRGQLEYEFGLLKKRVRNREPGKWKELIKVKKVEAHPAFSVRRGGVESWEKVKA